MVGGVVGGGGGGGGGGVVGQRWGIYIFWQFFSKIPLPRD